IHEGESLKHIFTRGMIFTNHARMILTEKNITKFSVEEAEKPDLDSYLKIGAFQKIISDKDPELFKEYSIEKDKFHQLDRNTLINGTNINFSLYLLNDLTFSILLETTGDRPAKLDNSMLPHYGDILIKKTDLHLLNDYL